MKRAFIAIAALGFMAISGTAYADEIATRSENIVKAKVMAGASGAIANALYGFTLEDILLMSPDKVMQIMRDTANFLQDNAKILNAIADDLNK